VPKTASRLLPPLIIFKAKFGARLMEKWSTVDNIAIAQKKTPYKRCWKMEFAQLFVVG